MSCPPPSALLISNPGSPSPHLGTASFSLLSAKPGHRPLSMPRHQSLAFASPSLQASTLSSPTHPPVCQRLADSCQSRHGHPPASGPNYGSSSTDWSSHCHPLGPQMNPSQGDDSHLFFGKKQGQLHCSSSSNSKDCQHPSRVPARQGPDHRKSPGGPLADDGLSGPSCQDS